MLSLEEKIKNTIVTVSDFPKPGIFYKDITPIFQDPELCKEILESMRAEFRGLKIDAVLGMESRGFLFGLPLAMSLDIPFILVRKKGKLPREAHAVSYSLEYGEAVIEMHKDALKPGQRVLIHDDVLATGGTAAAAAKLVAMAGAEVIGYSFISEIAPLNGRKLIESENVRIYTLLNS
jgi:adenine phosphoribosyltransferase